MLEMGKSCEESSSWSLSLEAPKLFSEGIMCYENLTPENSSSPASPQTSFRAYLNITSSIMLGKQKSFIHRMKVSSLKQEADDTLPS